MNLYLEFDAVVREFTNTEIRYVLVGGLAIGVHGYLRATEDMDFMIHPDDLPQVQELIEAKGYKPSGEPLSFKNAPLEMRRFIRPEPDSEDLHIIDLLIPEDETGINMIANAEDVAFSDIHIRVARKQDLIALKKARNSKSDQADIENLESSP